MKRQMVIAQILLVAGLGIRLLTLDTRSLWYDEGYTAAVISRSVTDIIRDIATFDTNTPLHYLLLKFWASYSGTSEFGLRLFSVFAELVTLALILRIAKHRSIVLVGVNAALSVVSISISQELRMYALLSMFATASAIALHLAISRRLKRWWWMWALSSVLTVSTHVLGVFVVSGGLITLLISPYSRRSFFRWRDAVLIVVATTGLVASMLIFILWTGTTYSAFDAKLVISDIGLSSLASLLLPRLSPVELTLPAALLATGLLVVAIVQTHPLPRQLAWTVVLSMLGIVTLSVLTGKYQGRYTAFLGPLLIASLASARSVPGIKGGQDIRSYFFTAFCTTSLIVNTAGSIAWSFTNTYPNNDFRGAVRFLETRRQPGDAVLLLSGHFEPVFAYYAKQSPALDWHALPNDPVLNLDNAFDYERAARSLNQAVAGSTGAWVVMWQNDLIDPSNIVQSLLRRQAHQLLPDEDITQFDGIRLLHFKFDNPYRITPEVLPNLDSSIVPNGPDVGLSSLGCTMIEPAQISSGTMEVICLWRKAHASTLPLDTQVSFRLRDESGNVVIHADQKLAYYGLPFLKYDRAISTFHYIPLPKNAQAGTYTLDAVPYTQEGEITPKVMTRWILAP